MALARVTILLGTAREGRQSEQVATWLFEHLQSRTDCEVVLHDIRDYMQDATVAPWQDEAAQLTWPAVVADTDAFIFVVPEYNWSFPGEFKMLLDQDLNGYLGKPVMVVGVSSGAFAGGRLMVSLAPYLYKLGLVQIPYQLFVGHVGDVLKESGALEAQFGERADTGVDKLLVYAQRLKGIQDEL